MYGFRISNTKLNQHQLVSEFLPRKRICFNNCQTIVFYYPGVVWNLLCRSQINTSELDNNESIE